METKASFFELTPDFILDAVEEAFGVRCTGQAMTLNSLENRVYDLELEDESHIVVKLYRPGRWTREQIQEEHNFLFALEKAEVPAVCPLRKDGHSLFTLESGIFFTAFPKVRGRLRDELSESQLRSVGRYLARIHNLGATHPFKHRLRLSTETWGQKSLDFLLDGQWIDMTYERTYQEAVEDIIDFLDEPLKKTPYLSVHGDCHLGNVLWQEEAPFFIDFDDSMLAPPVQDLWMVVRGRGEEADEMRDVVLSGYEEMRAFPRETLGLIEGLRALRMIHYSAWIARRWKDPIFKHHFPDFGTARYWQEELQALSEVTALLR